MYDTYTYDMYNYDIKYNVEFFYIIIKYEVFEKLARLMAHQHVIGTLARKNEELARFQHVGLQLADTLARKSHWHASTLARRPRWHAGTHATRFSKLFLFECLARFRSFFQIRWLPLTFYYIISECIDCISGFKTVLQKNIIYPVTIGILKRL